MRIFLTGNEGYVGRILSNSLLKENYDVIGCDIGYYPQDFIDEKQRITTIKKDLRDLKRRDLEGCFAVLHLAGLSNDPLGEINSSLTNKINYLETMRLARLSKEAGVERFIFSSSCSAYGANSELVNEASPLAPITEYAKSKVKSEYELLKLKDDNFSPVNLRNATVYGISPAMRLDLVVNNLTCSAFTTGIVKLMSDGTAWRPLLHIDDMASAFISVLNAHKDKVSGETFNVGSNDENYSVREIAEAVEDTISGSRIEYDKSKSKDTRSYKVDFSKINNQIGFKTKWNLKDGIKQIYEVIKKKQLTFAEFTDRKYYRVSYIKWLIQQGFVDEDLRVLKELTIS